MPSENRDLKPLHEPAQRQPEVVPDHHDALHPFAVALTQGVHQLGVLFVVVPVQPLLELVDHQHDLASPFGPPP